MTTTAHRALFDAGVVALRRGDAARARVEFLRLEASGGGSHQARLLLAQACTAAGDAVGAQAAIESVLAHEPGNLYALIMRGDLLASGGDLRAAVSWYRAALTHAPRLGPLSPDLHATLRRVQQAVETAGTSFQAHLDTYLAASGVAATDCGPRFAEALDIMAGRAPIQLQRPTSFYYPGLPQHAFFDRTMFDWVAALEAAAPAIRKEVSAVLNDGDGVVPYVAAERNRPAKAHPLLDDPSWSAFHLHCGGEIVANNARRCPVTMSALTAVPLPRIAGRAPNTIISVLRGGTHIPAHHGLLNTCLICHLPLIVPLGCRLRVGNETRAVEQDRVMIFDDSIEHEAWNDASTDRAVLLFEIWRPELDAAERAALTALYAAIASFESVSDEPL